MREGKKDIITHKFSIGKPNVESQGVTTMTERNKTHYLAPTKRDPCHELGNPGECRSYWTKLPKTNTHLDQLDEITLSTIKPPKGIYPISYLAEGVTRKLCEIGVGPYAYGLKPTYVTEPDEVDEDLPYLPELTFGQLVIQFNIKKPNLTIRQLAWALLKRDAAIMWECRQQFKKEIAQETWEETSNIVLPMTFMEPK